MKIICVGRNYAGHAAELGDRSGLRVTQRRNGHLLQDGNTDDLIVSESAR